MDFTAIKPLLAQWYAAGHHYALTGEVHPLVSVGTQLGEVLAEMAARGRP